MTGNFVYGLGEQLVSGEANAYSFTFTRLKYEGPHEFKRYAFELYKLADRLEKKLGSPQDIEWDVAKGKTITIIDYGLHWLDST
ncbi:pyruvate, water dikinase [Thermoflavimicrobium dichotomicum]|uniref:Pyruvate, water dikinase n=1 Tax=Thermoflavimicrobium dichotomicum TaxID=46223 RepID=A0A1I3P6K4_9BACL|nr:pyruvate, water dikinase [Thermoflavimicrobium dichotomicum]